MALIPENVQIIEVDIRSIEDGGQPQRETADFLVDFTKGRWTSQKITGEDKAVQWLGIGCKTELDRFPIYGAFGTPFESLIEEGLPRNVTEGEIIRGVEELGDQHEHIRSLNVGVDFQGNKAVVDINVNGLEERVVIS